MCFTVTKRFVRSLRAVSLTDCVLFGGGNISPPIYLEISVEIFIDYPKMLFRSLEDQIIVDSLEEESIKRIDGFMSLAELETIAPEKPKRSKKAEAHENGD